MTTNTPPAGDVRAPGKETPLSPADLVEHLANLAEELADAWWSSLSQSAVKATQEHAIADWKAIDHRIRLWTEETKNALQSVGAVHAKWPFPLPVSALPEFELSPADPAMNLHQLDITILYLIDALATALKAMTGESDDPIAAVNRVSQFWQEGGFALVSGRCSALAIAFRKHEEVLGEAVREHKTVSLVKGEPWEQEIASARRLIMQGLHEPSIPFILRAIRVFMAQSCGLLPGELVEPLSDAFAQDLPNHQVAVVLPLLEKASARIGKGGRVEIGSAVPISILALAATESLFASTVRPESLPTVVNRSHGDS